MREQELDALPEESEGFETTPNLPEEELPVTERDINELELVAAIKAGDIDTVRRLVDEPEIYINFEDPVTGLTPVQLAALTKDIGILRQVLRHNDTYVDKTDIRGNTSLHIALAQGEIGVAELLIKQGAAVNRVDGNGHEPIYSAVKRMDKYAVALLLRSGADPEGHRELELAQSIGAEDIAALLTIHQTEKAKVKLSLIDNIHIALAFNDSARAEKALAAGADVSAKDILGATTLHKALDNRSLRVLPPLLYHWSADIEATDDCGNTPLALAVSLSDPKSAELLLDRGASTSAINRFNEQPIHIAARVGSIELVDLLAKRGADITVKGGPDRQTPLEIANEHGHTKLVEWLTKDTVEPDMTSSPSYPPSGLQPAYAHTLASFSSTGLRIPTLEATVTHAEHVYPTIISNNPEETEGLDTTSLLPEEELPVTERDRNELELVAAIKAGDIDNVRRLVDEPEIYINFEDPVSGLTPLQLAARTKDIGILRQVLRHNDADVDQTDAQGRTSLHIALAQGEIGIAELLIKHGAAVNRVDDNGNKPIYSAVKRRDKYAVALLLRSGADPELRDGTERYTALELAQSIGAEDIVALLTIHQAEKAKVRLSLESQLQVAVFMDSVTQVKEAIAAGADVTTRNMLGSTALHKALDDRSLRVLPPLLYHWSADIEATDDHGNTPLALTVSLSDPKSAELLLDRGASTSAINRFNEQPIHIAARVGSIELVELLAKRGADITVRGGVHLQTPLEIATTAGHFDVAEKLAELSKPPAIAPEPSLLVHISSSVCPPSGLQPARTALAATALSSTDAPTPTASITHTPQGYQKTLSSNMEQLHGLGMPICLPKI